MLAKSLKFDWPVEVEHTLWHWPVERNRQNFAGAQRVNLDISLIKARRPTVHFFQNSFRFVFYVKNQTIKKMYL